MRKYKHLFFDLDHTLYDFDKSSELTLIQLFSKYQLGKYWDFEDFHESYKRINLQLWKDLGSGSTTKEALKVNRFLRTLREKQDCSVTQAKEMSEFYMNLACQQTTLVAGALEVLEQLNNKYQLHIITNGFVEVQYKKMDCTGLSPFFKQVFISEKIGASKPSVKFFEHAVRSCNAKKEESLVIGDNFDTDIQGAINFKLDSVWFCPHISKIRQEKSSATYEIAELTDLLTFL